MGGKMAQEIDIKKYVDFVDVLTSKQSKEFDSYIGELKKLKDLGCDIPRLDCAITGMCSESGEAEEILKKLKFQGKEWNEDTRFHLKREAGDIIFYWINFCLALGYSPYEIIEENVAKLESRYPGGKFSVWHSENRKEGDL
jgi:NTP pyrophosphatase (non-canonical NTP hydrolase)